MKASKHKRKHKKSIDNQAEYYYPVKNSEDQEKETSPPRITYSLRKRNKKADVSYVEKSEDEFDDEDFNDQKPKAQKVGSHPNQQANKPGRKRMNDPEDIRQRNKRTKTQEEDHEDDANYQMQNSLVDSQRYDFNNMSHMYPARQPQGAQFRNRQLFTGNDFNMMSQGFEPEYNFNQSTMRPKSDLIPRRQSSNVMPMNAEPRTQGGNPGMKRERRSKKYFDQKFISQPEMDDYINPINSEFLEQRSGSNNRLGLNEDKGTEKSNKDSILFPFQEEEENNSSNKDLPPENDLRQINDQLQENEPSLGEEVNKLATKDLSRQDSTRFLNYENQPGNESFGPNTFQFKERMGSDYPESRYSQQFNYPMGMGWNNYAQEGDYRNFQMNQMPRMHQNSFGNMFVNQNRNNYPFGQDYSPNVMNPNNQHMDS